MTLFTSNNTWILSCTRFSEQLLRSRTCYTGCSDVRSDHAFEDAAGGGERVPHLAPDSSTRSSRSMQIVLAKRLQSMVEGRVGREIGQLGNG
jgi:hypothetical protein